MIDKHKFIWSTLEKAGRKLIEIQKDGFKIRSKMGDYRNLVTDADITIDRLIKKEINDNFHNEGIYSEETGGILGSHGPLWIIDPIDGTSNFARGIPHFAIALTYLEDGEVVSAGVFNPITGDFFSFRKEDGSFLNDKKISVSQISSLKEAYVLLHIGRKPELHSWGLGLQDKLLKEGKKTINLGSSALDLCFLAAGRVDAVIYGTLTTADVAGALAIVRGALGEVYDWEGGKAQLNPNPQKIVATSSWDLFEQLVN